MTAAPLIALDADGVLLDYHEGYARGWEKAFGTRPSVRNPRAYHPMQYWDVPVLTAQERVHFSQHGMTEEIWSSMPALEGALEACQMLREAGFRLTCVTALPNRFEDARALNLRTLGFELEAVHAVGGSLARNPKVRALGELKPTAFVDDYLGYLQGLPPGIWRALVEGRPEHSPNRDPALQAPHSRHVDLQDFARWALVNLPRP